MQSQFNIGYNLKASMNIIGIRLLIKDEFETIRAVCNPALLNRTPKQLEKTENAHIIFKFPKFPFPKGKYHVHLTAYSADGVADNIEHAAEFEVEGGDYYGTGREAYVKDGVLIDFDFSFNNS